MRARITLVGQFSDMLIICFMSCSGAGIIVRVGVVRGG